MAKQPTRSHTFIPTTLECPADLEWAWDTKNPIYEQFNVDGLKMRGLFEWFNIYISGLQPGASFTRLGSAYRSHWKKRGWKLTEARKFDKAAR